MPIFVVRMYETHISAYEIEADSIGRAIEAVYGGDGTLKHTEYSETPEDIGFPASKLSKSDQEILCLDDDDIVSSIQSAEQCRYQ